MWVECVGGMQCNSLDLFTLKHKLISYPMIFGDISGKQCAV